MEEMRPISLVVIISQRNFFTRGSNMKKTVSMLSVIIFSFFAMTANVLAADSDDFVITVKTDNLGTSTDTQFTIPTRKIFGAKHNYNVDCDNDGTDEGIAQTGDYTCDYGAGNAGTYTVRIKDNKGDGTGFPRIYFNDSGDKEKLLTITQWGTGGWKTMASAFYGCSNLTTLPTDQLVLIASPFCNLSEMFRDASSVVFNSSIEAWDTSGVKKMLDVFSGVPSFTQDISGWDVSGVTHMAGMFDGVTLSTPNYDKLLIGWDAQILRAGVTFSAGNSVYCSLDAQTARTNMVDVDGWTITDGGLCPDTTAPVLSEVTPVATPTNDRSSPWPLV